jgi:hypothetical protein
MKNTIKVRRQATRFRTKHPLPVSTRDISACLKAVSPAHAEALRKAMKDPNMPVEIGIDLHAHRLDLTLKLADALDSLSKVALQLCDSLNFTH